jgi:hypothetical protein
MPKPPTELPDAQVTPEPKLEKRMRLNTIALTDRGPTSRPCATPCASGRGCR